MMSVIDLTNVSKAVIDSLLMVIKDNQIDIDSIMMQLSANNGENTSEEVNLGELTRQLLGELVGFNLSQKVIKIDLSGLSESEKEKYIKDFRKIEDLESQNKSPWIDVNEKLPELGIAVIATNENYENGEFWWAYERYQGEDGWCWARFDNGLFEAFTDDDYEITHWMPVPELKDKNHD